MKIAIKNNGINIPTAIFIDGSWLYVTSRRIDKKIDYANLFNALTKKFGTKTEVHYYGTIDPTNKQQEKFYTSLKKIGYIIHCTQIRKVDDKVISTGLGVSLVVDAMRILSSLKNFILISGDSDFVPLLKQAGRIGVNTYIIALPFSTGYVLRKVANNFLNLETLTAEYKPRTFRVEAKIEKFVSQNYIKKGESFKSYIKLRDLMKSTKKSVIIIDQYVDEQILLMIELLKPEINKIIITNTKNITSPDFFVQVKKMEKDGHLIVICNSKKFHDRFIGIDNIWWHSGHSFKNLGERDSMINKITDRKEAKKLDNEIIKITSRNEN